MLVDIVAVSVLEGYRLRLRFDDGTEGEFDVADATGFAGVFESLRDPGYFARVTVNPELGTVVWPNGADAIVACDELPGNLYGWWRITETSQWVNDGLDDLGPALISITGHADRLRMHCLLAYVNVRPTRAGASFTWEGAWEYDQMNGTGSVRLGRDGKLHGRIKIKGGDESTFIAEKATEPAKPIDDPPRYRDKWRRRW